MEIQILELCNRVREWKTRALGNRARKQKRANKGEKRNGFGGTIRIRTSRRQRAFCITLRVTGSSTRGNYGKLLKIDKRRRGNDRVCHRLDSGSNPGLASLFKNVMEGRSCVDSPPNRRESAREVVNRDVDARWRLRHLHPGVVSKICHLL